MKDRISVIPVYSDSENHYKLYLKHTIAPITVLFTVEGGCMGPRPLPDEIMDRILMSYTIPEEW